MKAELRALTGARGVAAWLVVLYHIRLSIAGLPPRVVDMLAKGYLAVDFFFLLSGFVIALTWEERLRDGGRSAVRAFWWKRVARVWPLHVAMLGLALALALALAATGRADPAAFPPGEVALHVVLLQNWGLTDHPTWNVPAWSISAEAGAYLLFPAILAGVDWRRWPTAALLAAMAALFLLLHAVFVLAGASGLGVAIGRLGLPRCAIEFTAGAIACAVWRRWRDAPFAAASGCALVPAAALAALALGAPETLLVPAAFAAMVLALALAGDRRNPLASRPLHFLGRISYATYLAHFLLFIIFQKLLFVADAHAIPPALIALYLALVFAASIALYYCVERPAQRWLERLPRHRRARGGAATA